MEGWRRAQFVLALFVFFATAPYAHSAYKCQDKNGQWHYADSPYGLPESCLNKMEKKRRAAEKPKVIEPIKEIKRAEPPRIRPSKPPKNETPSDEEYKKSVAHILPNYWKVMVAKVKFKKNIGSKTSPTIDALLGVKIKAKEDLYKKSQWKKSGGREKITQVSLSHAKGAETNILVESVSEYVSGKWKIQSKIDDATKAISIPGKPLKSFKGKPTIVSSAEAKAPPAPAQQAPAQQAVTPAPITATALKPVTVGGKSLKMLALSCVIHTEGVFAGNIDIALTGSGLNLPATQDAIAKQMRVRFPGSNILFDVLGYGMEGSTLRLTFFTEGMDVRGAPNSVEALWKIEKDLAPLNGIQCRKEPAQVSATKDAQGIAEEMLPPAERVAPKTTPKPKRPAVRPMPQPIPQPSQPSMAEIILPLIFALTFAIVTISGLWKMFKKAGRSGISCLIPFYNFYVMIKIAGRPWWWLILLFVPFVNFVINIMISIDIAKNFGKSTLFGLGMFILPFIFLPILGHGKAKYNPIQR